MKELTSEARQCAVHMRWGFLPVFMVRVAVPDWGWELGSGGAGAMRG